MIALDAGLVQIIVAIIAAAGATIAVQLRVHADNRKDHGETAENVKKLLTRQGDIVRDVTYIRADLSDVRGTIRELRVHNTDQDARITHVEHHQEATQ